MAVTPAGGLVLEREPSPSDGSDRRTSDEDRPNPNRSTRRGLHPDLRRRVDGWVRRTLVPERLLIVIIGLYASYFSALLVMRHERFATYDYDLGIFDQAVWQLSQGESFMSLRGLDFWGHHVEPAMALFVPFYWMGAGASTLNVAMVVSLALGANPVFRLAKRLTSNEWFSLVLASAYLVHYSSQWILQETFHPEVMAVAPMLAAWVAASEERWKAFAAWLVFAIAWKEDVAMAAAMMGIVLGLRGHRKAGGLTFLGAAGWFLFATEVILPAFGGDAPFYGGLYGDLGTTPLDVAKTGLTDPLLVGGVLVENHAVGDFRDLLAPYGLLSLRSPLPLLMAVPQFFASHLTITSFSTGNKIHYVAMPLVAATISMVEGVGRVRPSLRPWAVGLIAASCLAVSSAWGANHFSVQYDNAIWWHPENPRQAVLEEAVGLIPDDAPISASYAFAPKLAHRTHAYGFPNPWVSTNWAVDPSDLPDPSIIEWLVIDFEHLGPEGRDQLHVILTEEPWEIVMSESNIVVARRLD